MSIRQKSMPFAPARGLDAVLRVGVAEAMLKKTNNEKEMEAWLEDAKTKLSAESDQLTQLRSKITQLRLALKRSKDETKSKTIALELAEVRASRCVRRRTKLAMQLAAQAVEVRAFERENKEIVETIDDLKRLCEGYVPYEGSPYEEYEP